MKMKALVAWGVGIVASGYVVGKFASLSSYGVRTQSFAWEAAIGVALVGVALCVAVWATSRDEED